MGPCITVLENEVAAVVTTTARVDRTMRPPGTTYRQRAADITHTLQEESTLIMPIALALGITPLHKLPRSRHSFDGSSLEEVTVGLRNGLRGRSGIVS